MARVAALTLDAVFAIKWKGNFHEDHPNFVAVDDFIKNHCKSVEDACKALDSMTKNGMGIDEKSDVDDLKRYLRDMDIKPISFTLPQ